MQMLNRMSMVKPTDNFTRFVHNVLLLHKHAVSRKLLISSGINNIPSRPRRTSISCCFNCRRVRIFVWYTRCRIAAQIDRIKVRAVRRSRFCLNEMAFLNEEIQQSHEPCAHVLSLAKKQAVREAATIYRAPCKLTFDLLTLKMVSESRVTWATFVPILVFLSRPLCSRLSPDVRDRQTSDVRRASSLNAPTLGAKA